MVSLATIVTSAALLPGFGPAATGPAGGRVLTGVFPGTVRPGFVYLPPHFSPSVRYPVVYLLHGMPGSPSEFLDGTDLAAFADRGIAGGRLRPFIAVAPAVVQLVPWIDARLPTIAGRRGRVLAGLSAGGFGAIDIGLRHPGLFGAIESWSGYFAPLHDGPFKAASRPLLAAHDPTQLVLEERPVLQRDGTRFYVSTGPPHSHWAKPAQTFAFGDELHAVGLRYTLRVFRAKKDEWRDQLDDGLTWALTPAS